VRGLSLAVEVARYPVERNQGLMYRRSMAPDSGMLFVFEEPETLRFWMKNTLIPLSIAFVNLDSIITDILEMAPGDTVTPYTSTGAALYAVEMNSGWFLSHGIKPGDTVSGLPAR
jgi:uncharacterized protein